MCKYRGFFKITYEAGVIFAENRFFGRCENKKRLRGFKLWAWKKRLQARRLKEVKLVAPSTQAAIEEKENKSDIALLFIDACYSR